jgi:hypothetical protein
MHSLTKTLSRVRFSETSAARRRNSECAWQSSSSTSPRLSAPICRVSDKLPLRNIASFMRLEWKVLNRNHLGGDRRSRPCRGTDCNPGRQLVHTRKNSVSSTKCGLRLNLSGLTYGLESPGWDTSLGLCLRDSLRWISGQNSFTTIAMVSYPTCVPHTLAVFGRVRSDAL